MATPSKTDLGTLFFGAYRQRVLGLLLLHPDESFHLREIARLTDTQPGTLRRELALLADAGVLHGETAGNQKHYRANAACPIYEELRSILVKTSGVADVLRGALASLGTRVAMAFIYGSMASASERKASDIDVMVVGSATLEDVVRALNPCQEQLRREINPHVYSASEFTRKVRKNDPFISRVLAGPRILIAGKPDEFGKPGANRKAKAS
jgi:predicted nucleotidyltransferase